MRRRFTTSIEPARVTVFDPSLGVHVRRTIGHRWRCTCGERGAVQDTPALARSGGRRHVFDAHVD